MRYNEFAGDFYIIMSHHGVKGAAVQTTDADVKNAISDVKRSMKRDRVTVDMLKEIQSKLAAELTKMLPEIARHGNAIDSSGEFYDKQTFDNDLILCAVYDHIANGKVIAITNNIGPNAGDTINE